MSIECETVWVRIFWDAVRALITDADAQYVERSPAAVINVRSQTCGGFVVARDRVGRRALTTRARPEAREASRGRAGETVRLARAGACALRVCGGSRVRASEIERHAQDE